MYKNVKPRGRNNRRARNMKSGGEEAERKWR